MNRRLTAIAVVPVLLTPALPDRLAAEPYLAVRMGLKCAVCHVNRTGGGGRNLFGSQWAQTALPIKALETRNRALNDWLAFGFDVRTLATALVSDADPRTNLEMSEAQLQLEARLVPGALALYVDETVGPSQAFAREAFLLVERLPLNGYAKAGKFMPPYGWRIWDDAAYIRSQTGFGYRTPDLGVEVGIEPGPLSWFVSVTNGSVGAVDNNSGKMVTSTVAVVYPEFRVGASGSYNPGTTSDRSMIGGFAGTRVGPLVILGEADLIRDSFTAATPDRDQLATYVEGVLLVSRGVNVKATWGLLDPDRDEAEAEDERTRGRFGVELFPVSFVQISAFYTMLDVPGVTTDRDFVSLEAHLHF
jgi:hypothetical protein